MISADSGNKYLSKMFNDDWMRDQGFGAETEGSGDLRDLIGRRHDQGASVTVGPDDTLQVAYARMKLYDVSQLPVLEGDRVVGLIDESDLLLAVFERALGFHDPVRAAMVTDIETVEANQPIQALLTSIRQGVCRRDRRRSAFPWPRHPHRSPQRTSVAARNSYDQAAQASPKHSAACRRGRSMGGSGPIPRPARSITPIYASSTFVQSSPGVNTGWEYSRTGNPTRAAFEAALAELEGGASGFAFASGLAAQAAVLELLDQGAHVIASDDLYGGSWRLFHRVRERTAGLKITHVDASDAAAVETAITPETRLIWIETPGNPLLEIADLAASPKSASGAA